MVSRDAISKRELAMRLYIETKQPQVPVNYGEFRKVAMALSLGTSGEPDIQQLGFESHPLFVSIKVEDNSDHIHQIAIATFDSKLIESQECNAHTYATHYRPIAAILHNIDQGHTKNKDHGILRHLMTKLKQNKDHITQDRAKQLLTRAVHQKGSDGKQRDIVLVGHDIVEQLVKIASILDVNLLSDPHMKAVVDVQLAARSVYPPTRDMTPAELNDTIKLPRSGNKTEARNPALQTLRALLCVLCDHERARVHRWHHWWKRTDEKVKPNVALLEEIAERYNVKEQVRQVGVNVSRKDTRIDCKLDEALNYFNSAVWLQPS